MRPLVPLCLAASLAACGPSADSAGNVARDGADSGHASTPAGDFHNDPAGLLDRYFTELREGGDAAGLFPPGGAPALAPHGSVHEHRIGDATTEGAAGSVYATVPVDILFSDPRGQARRLSGTIVLRRVNDVPGSTADQRRWRFESADLQPRR